MEKQIRNVLKGKKIILILLIVFTLEITSVIYSKYLLTRSFDVQITTAPFYFEAEANKTRVVSSSNQSEFELTIKNNDGTNYNINDTTYEISISNSKYTFLVDGKSVTSKTIKGNSLIDEVLKITLVSSSGATLDDIENVDVKIVSTYPYQKEINITVGVVEKQAWTYSYANASKTFTTPISGNYKIELWGAQGAGTSSYAGGKGAYTCGNIYLDEGTNLYVYVGASSTSTTTKVFNGGGLTRSLPNSTYAYGGGGATDVRLDDSGWNDFDSLKSRIMVAAGGGGAVTYAGKFAGANAGGLTGYSGSVSSTNDGRVATGGTQTLGGKNGVGSNSGSSDRNSFGQSVFSYGQMGGGGNGYYAGGNGAHGTNTIGSGAGGSSFISGHNGCDAIKEESTSSSIVHSGQSVHYSGYKFTNTIMIDGAGYKWTTSKASASTGMPQKSGTGTMTGNTGNGYAKITFIGE